MSVTARIERLRQCYINSRPSICCERARIYTESHRRTEGQPTPIRRAQAFYDFCSEFEPIIFVDELIVGTAGKFRRSGILTPEYSWRWVDKEMDSFETRPQDPYQMSEEQRRYVRENIFPYWKNQSLEEFYISQLPDETAYRSGDNCVFENES